MNEYGRVLTKLYLPNRLNGWIWPQAEFADPWFSLFCYNDRDGEILQWQQ